MLFSSFVFQYRHLFIILCCNNYYQYITVYFVCILLMRYSFMWSVSESRKEKKVSSEWSLLSLPRNTRYVIHTWHCVKSYVTLYMRHLLTHTPLWYWSQKVDARWNQESPCQTYLHIVHTQVWCKTHMHIYTPAQQQLLTGCTVPQHCYNGHVSFLWEKLERGNKTAVIKQQI